MVRCCLQLSESNTPSAGDTLSTGEYSIMLALWSWVTSDISSPASSSSCMSQSCSSILAMKSHKNKTYLCCWLQLSLNKLCLLIRDIVYIMWPLVSIYIPSEAQYKITVVNHITVLWITLPFHLAVKWIQAQLHRKWYMKHPKHTF